MGFYDVFDTLVDQPEIGFIRAQLPPGIRVFAHCSYLIFYRLTKDRIVIERVLHGARDWETILQDD